MAKHTYTNLTTGPKGLHTTAGLVFIDPGATSEPVELNEGELAGAKETGWWKLDGGAEPGPADTSGDLSKNTVDELRVIAAAEGVTLEDGAKKADIVAAIEAKRAAAPPT